MANYAYFRPTSFSQTETMDEFVDPSNCYDLNDGSYTKLDIDADYTGQAHGSGLVFVPNSQASLYNGYISENTQYNIAETLPNGAIIVGAGCGISYTSRVSSLGDTPDVQIGITNGNTSNLIFTNSDKTTGTMIHQPPKGNTNTIYRIQTGWTNLALNDTTINYNLNWIRNNARTWIRVKGYHDTVLSSTVIWLREMWMFARWMMPLKVRSMTGCTTNDTSLINRYEYGNTATYAFQALPGYTPEDPIITFHQGNVAWSYIPYTTSGRLTIPMTEGVEFSIEFRKKKQSLVNNSKVQKVLVHNSNCSTVLVDNDIVFYN